MKVLKFYESHKAWPCVVIRKQHIDGRWVFRDIGGAIGWLRQDRRRGQVSIISGGINNSFDPIDAVMEFYISNERAAFDFKMRFA